jgi:hypothetical protein
VLAINSVCTLGDIVIANPTQVDLVSWDFFFGGFTMIVMVHVKNGLYHDQFLAHMFFPTVIEVFGSLHQQANMFLY